MDTRGVIVGCDQNQEWLLPWWWYHYSNHNSYPVAFMDFGMSKQAVAWCSERGQYVPCVLDGARFNEALQKHKKLWKNIVDHRCAWFKKPFACLHSPFYLSCWIDLDCEIRGELSPLFDAIFLGADLAMAQDYLELFRKYTPLIRKETLYNTGVVAFKRDTNIISQWAEKTLSHNRDFRGDQDVLSWLISRDHPKLVVLPRIYNWQKECGPNPQAIVVHYAHRWKIKILADLFVRGLP